jgi:tRNA pseudouridine55 synthase
MSGARRAWRAVDGVLLLDKPSGVSSNAALQRARRAFLARKGGHTGTLDPLASGLLPLCFGEATKFAQFLLDAGKRYRATVRFGVETDTLDAEGKVVAVRPVGLDAAIIAATLPAFTGRQLQTPPAHSALKYQGRAYYDYARAGEDVPRAPRPVEVMRLDLLAWQPPDAIIDVECSKGTYVRVIAADLGARLGCGAHLAALRRTATGGFTLEQAVTLDRLEAMADEARSSCLLPPDVLVAHLPRVDLDTALASAFLQGQAVDMSAVREASPATGPCAVFGPQGLLGVADCTEDRVLPRRVRAASPAPPASGAGTLEEAG